jgi:hypothetical protein
VPIDGSEMLSRERFEFCDPVHAGILPRVPSRLHRPKRYREAQS